MKLFLIIIIIIGKNYSNICFTDRYFNESFKDVHEKCYTGSQNDAG